MNIVDEQIIKIAKHLLTIKPKYRPEMCHGWVRRYVGNLKRLERLFVRRLRNDR